METQAVPSVKSAKIVRFLPYLAVFQADVKQTLRNWIYRAWVVLTIGAAVGYLMYGFGARQETGMVVHAHNMISNIFHWIMWGSVTLIIVLASGTICSERGNIADSILCRGISRYQYFMGKWHARLAVILGTYTVMATAAIIGSMFLLHGESLSLHGCVLAMITIAALLVLVITTGVTVSALANSTVLSIAIVWMCLYGSAFLLSFLPGHYPSPDRAMKLLPNILRGDYDFHTLSRLITGSLAASVFVALVGLVCFSKRDV